MFDLIAISIPIVLAICLVIAIRILSDANVRKRLAETQSDPESIRILLDSLRRDRTQTAFGWAVALVLIGMAMLVIAVFNIAASDPLAFGLVAVAAGSALLVALTVGRRF